MSKPNLSNLLKNAKTFASTHSPEILTGIGIAGMITTTILAVKATPRAMLLLEMERELKNAESDRDESVELTPVEVVKATWKCYIPAVVTGTMSVACLIGASSVHVKRTAALATAYKLSETALTEYREKVIETIGENKEKSVREKVHKEQIDSNPVSKNEVIITKKGSTLCYDAISGRYFKSDIDKIRKAENNLNKKMLNDMYVSLNDFYDELDLDHINIGYDLGWNLDDGLINLDFSSHIADDGTPCIVVDYRVAPKYGFSKFL